MATCRPPTSRAQRAGYRIGMKIKKSKQCSFKNKFLRPAEQYLRPTLFSVCIQINPQSLHTV